MARRKTYRKSHSKDRELSNLFIKKDGLLKVIFNDGSYGYVVSFWLFDVCLFTRRRTEALKVINSNKPIDDNDILNLLI